MNDLIVSKALDMLSPEEKEQMKKRVIRQAEKMALGSKVSVSKSKKNPETGRWEVVEKTQQYQKPNTKLFFLILERLFSEAPKGQSEDVLGELEDREQWLKSKLKKVKGYKKIYKELEEDVIEGEVIDEL